MQDVKQCPICKGESFKNYLACQDFTVSHETFHLVKCNGCGFVITSPRPNDADLGKYYASDNYISHTSKSRSLFDLVYIVSRHFTVMWKLNIIRKNSERPGASTLLDFGCGTGDFLKKCREKGYVISGVEPSSIARTKAEELLKININTSLTELNKAFDVITLWHVLEHVPDLNEKLSTLKIKLSKNGTMFIAVPNHQSFDAKNYGSSWAGYDVPRHLWHFDQTTMQALLRKNGLILNKVIPMPLDAFYVSMLSEKYKSGKNSPGAMIEGAMKGFQSNIRAKQKKEFSSLIYVIKHES